MIGTLKRIFGMAPAPDFRQLVKNGAQIIDVRTRGEYAAGHIDGSINIPLNELHAITERFRTDTILIFCCASGVRSASARDVLQRLGFTKVYNGGGWTALNEKLRNINN